MRFSLQSLAICLVSTQARLAFAGPCRPLTTTSVGATTTTAMSGGVSTGTTLSEEPTTTAAGETSIVTLSEESTTTTLPDLSTTITLSEVSTTVLSEQSTTATVAETTTTTAVDTTTTTTVAEITTTVAAGTTTTAAETTTTTSGPKPSLYAQYEDGSEVGAYLQPFGYIGTQAEGSSEAKFALEAGTSRLYLTQSDGSKLYAFTVIPTGPNYVFAFDTADNVNMYPQSYHFIICTTDSELVLTCSSEIGPTPIYWYLPSGSSNFYGNSASSAASFGGNTPVSFRLPGGQ